MIFFNIGEFFPQKLTVSAVCIVVRLPAAAESKQD
jgi:hypothetical protein